MLLPPLFEDAVRTRVFGKFSKASEVFARASETGWTALLEVPPRGSHGTSGTKVGVQYFTCSCKRWSCIPCRSTREYAPCSTKWAVAVGASSAVTLRVHLTPPWPVPLVRCSRLLGRKQEEVDEGVYSSNISDVPPSKALQGMTERMGSGSWVDEAGSKELVTSSHLRFDVRGTIQQERGTITSTVHALLRSKLHGRGHVLSACPYIFK